MVVYGFTIGGITPNTLPSSGLLRQTRAAAITLKQTEQVRATTSGRALNTKSVLLFCLMARAGASWCVDKSLAGV